MLIGLVNLYYSLDYEGGHYMKEDSDTTDEQRRLPVPVHLDDDRKNISANLVAIIKSLSDETSF
jgi:hypothetical protein